MKSSGVYLCDNDFEIFEVEGGCGQADYDSASHSDDDSDVAAGMLDDGDGCWPVAEEEPGDIDEDGSLERPAHLKRVRVAMLNNVHVHIRRQLEVIARTYSSVWARFLYTRMEDGSYQLPMLVAADNTSRTRFSGLSDKIEVGYFKFVIPLADVMTGLQSHSWATLLFLAEGVRLHCNKCSMHHARSTAPIGLAVIFIFLL
jgi:hypothetical protein